MRHEKTETMKRKLALVKRSSLTGKSGAKGLRRKCGS